MHHKIIGSVVEEHGEDSVEVIRINPERKCSTALTVKRNATLIIDRRTGDKVDDIIALLYLPGRIFFWTAVGNVGPRHNVTSVYSRWHPFI